MVDLATQLLMDREGFASSAYWDVNHWRVGYGSDTWTDSNGHVHNVTQNTTVTADQAAADLSRRVGQTQQGVIDQIGQTAWDNLSSGAQAGLTSYAYNYGSLTPSVARAAQSGDSQAIASAIAARAVDNGGVNAARRAIEAQTVLAPSAAHVTTNTAGPDDRPNMAQLYGTPPAPLTPPRADSAASSLPSNADFLSQMGIGNPATPYDPASPAPAQHITDMNYPVASLPPPNLPLNGPPAATPSFLPTGSSWKPTAAPPVPMPTPSFALPVVSSPAAPAADQHLVTLPSGKQIATGTYKSPSNDGSIITVADDGTGQAIIKTIDPGLAGGIGPGTVAGSIVGKTIGDAVSSSLPAAKQALGQAGSDIGSAASNLGSNAAAFGGSLLSGIGGLFGGSKPPPVPSAPSFLPSGSNWSTPLTSSSNSGSSGSQPAPSPSFLPSGNSWSTPLTPPPVPSAPPPAPTTISVANPAYATWQAQYGNQGGTTGMSVGGVTVTGTSPTGGGSSKFDGTDSTLMGSPPPMPTVPPPPPKYITQTVAPKIPTSIGAPVPMPMPSWLAPVMPTSATFGTDPISQLIAKSKLGGPISFLGGAQNNYGYLNQAASASGTSAADLHARLMAQQHNPAQIDQNGNPVTAMNGQTSRASPYVNSFGMVN